ncbi:MAG: histone deacetylase family protein [Alphaproteobacteria bacterium]|nr:histone deacetylase family protein [Alphaproteobacteria bacterium]
MQIYFDERQQQHSPKAFLLRGKVVDSPERPERAEAFLAALAQGKHPVSAPTDHGEDPIHAVHDPGYLHFLRSGHRSWSAEPGASPEITPNIHPNRHMATKPSGMIGVVGWYTADTACPVGANTWEGAYWSAQTALSAADHLVETGQTALALCRPPGHHAYHDMAGGFCFLNNAAIAAQRLRQVHDRVAILDVDVHHGNGTQGIFYDRSDVLTVSLHGDPSVFYPWYAGYAEETGQGAGADCNLNIPLPRGTGDQEFLDALPDAFDKIRAFDPGAVIVALGLDGSEQDPLQFFQITTEGFRRMGAAIAGLPYPIMIEQEGGYPSPILGDNLRAFVEGFEDARAG